MRLFVACALPFDVKLAIEARVAELRRDFPAASWVRAESMHLTLAFIGEQPDSVVPVLHDALKAALQRSVRVSARIAGAGIFPNERRPRVGWLAVEPQSELERLATAVRNGLLATSVDFDQKPFKSHVTLARFRENLRADDARKFLAHFADFASTPFAINEVILYSSVLSSKGAQHTALARIELATG